MGEPDDIGKVALFLASDMADGYMTGSQVVVDGEGSLRKPCLYFNIFKIRKLYKEAKENPGKVAGEELSGALTGLIAEPAIVFLGTLPCVFVCCVGFTVARVWVRSVYTAAKILFYILLPIFLIVFLGMRFIVRRMKKRAEI